MSARDPNSPQQPQQSQQPQQPQAQANPLSGLHLLESVGNIATALGYFFAGGQDDDDEVEEAPKPRRFRPRVFGAGTSSRVGKGSCCRRPVGK